MEKIIEYDKTTKLTSHYFLNENNDVHGLVQRFYENGIKRSDSQYENNLRHGITKVYNNDGIKTLEGSYKKGVPNGVMRRKVSQSEMFLELFDTFIINSNSVNNFSNSGIQITFYK